MSAQQRREHPRDQSGTVERPNVVGVRTTVRRWALRAGPIAVVLLFLLSSSASAVAVGPTSSTTVSAPFLHAGGPSTTPVVSHGPTSVGSSPHVQAPSQLPHAAPAAPRPSANNTTYVENGSAAFFSSTNVSQPIPKCVNYYSSNYCWNITTEPS
ncbi:MAG TPA: hypothetical protein VIZ68_05215, partial [Thermoplasmata archaeon]